MNFLANENFPVFSIKLLRKGGHNVASVIEETPGAKDRDVLKRAYEESRIVLTFDRDYGELIYRHKLAGPAGIVFFRFNPSGPEEPGEMLLKILEIGKVSMLERFTVVERGRIRQRSLYRKR
jgi:predicted nuclease of predicted toxin-antitoxin system